MFAGHSRNVTPLLNSLQCHGFPLISCSWPEMLAVLREIEFATESLETASFALPGLRAFSNAPGAHAPGY